MRSRDGKREVGRGWGIGIRESPPQFKNQIMAHVYVRSITGSTMYQKAPFC